MLCAFYDKHMILLGIVANARIEVMPYEYSVSYGQNVRHIFENSSNTI